MTALLDTVCLVLWLAIWNMAMPDPARHQMTPGAAGPPAAASGQTAAGTREGEALGPAVTPHEEIR